MGSRSIIEGMPAKISSLLEGESERGIILILSAYLEEILGDIIRDVCVSSKYANEILEFRQPAGDFSSKITLAAALGLIHESEATALNSIRKIRNRAAHFDKKGEGFEVLFDSKHTVILVENYMKTLNLSMKGKTPGDVKNGFIVASRLLATKLMLRGALLPSLPKPKSIESMAKEARDSAKGTDMETQLKVIEEILKKAEQEGIVDSVIMAALLARQRIKA